MKTLPEAGTLGAALKSARAALASVPGGDLDAELLVAHVAGLSRTALYAWPERSLAAAAAACLEHKLGERRAGVPLAYLTGRRAFHAIELAVNASVLVPRPETELLVDRALALVLPAGARVLDAGCGSGAVALALKHARPDLEVFASDRSLPALAVSRANRERLQLDVPHLAASWTDALAPACLDVVISNPPYVAEGDPALTGDIRHEPRLALTAGAEGLDALRKLCTTDALRPGGWLLLEHGHDQGAAVRGLLAAGRFTGIHTHRDLAGHERVSGGQRPQDPQE